MSNNNDSRRYTALFYLTDGGPLRTVSFASDEMRQADPAGAHGASENFLDDLALKHAKAVIAEKFGVADPQDLRLARQGDYLRDAARELGLEQKQFAERLNTPWRTFEKWLFPEDSKSQRTMPDMAWTFVDDILRSHARSRKT